MEPPVAIEVPTPGEPTSDERRHHGLTPLPYQPWCNVCVRARGRENRHVSRSQNQPDTPVIQCDNCFLKTHEDAPMITVLVVIDTVHKQMVAIPLEKKGNRDPFASRSLAAFARYVGHPKMIIQGDPEHALMAVIHDACALLTAARPRTSPVNSKGSSGAAVRAIQAVEGMARTLRLDLLGRTNIAVGSDLPITSWMGRHAAWLLSHFRTGSENGKTAYARQFERPYESPVPPFAERVMWKDPTLQPATLKSSWGYGLWLGRSQTSKAHLIGTREGIVVARTIRRLPASEREDSNLVVAMRGTPVAGRPADAAAGDAPTVTRHAVEHGEVLVVPASSGAPLQAGSGDGVSAPSNPVPNLPKPTVARAQPSSATVESSHHPSGVRELTVLFLVVTCLRRWHKLWNRQRSHTLRWRRTMRVSFQRDREGDPRRTVGQVRDHPNTQLVVQAATDAATDIC